MPFADDVAKILGSVEDALPEINDLIGTITGKPVSVTAPKTTGAVSTGTGTGTGTTTNADKYIKWALTGLAVLVLGFFGWKLFESTEKHGKKETSTGAE